MLPPLAGVDALAERLGVTFDGDTPDYARALAALEDASSLIRSETGRDFIDDHGDIEEGIPDIVVSVCMAAAYRAFRNPDGTTQTSVGDVSVTFTREGVAGSVFLTKAELRAVRKGAGTASYGSIAMETPYGLNPSSARYVEVAGGGDKLPIGPLPWEA